MKEIKLNLDGPKQKKLTTAERFNNDHVGVEFYVHMPHSTAPMMYFITSSREDADEMADGHPDAEILVREVGEWKAAP